MLAGYDHLLAAGRRLQWDDAAIDLSGDRSALEALPPAARTRIIRLLAGFWVAEHGVADELAPFLAETGGIAREAFTLQAADERRHARFFDRAWRALAAPGADPRAAAAPEITALFAVRLPAMAAKLAARETGLTHAVGLYHLILEAIVLAVGELALLQEAAPLPGLAAGAARVQADERWHVGLGVQVLADAGAGSAVVAPLAERAARAWGPGVSTPERVEWALASHRRRLAVIERQRTTG